MYKDNVILKKRSKQRIRKRIRKKMNGTQEMPRVHIFKSNRYIYSQVIDDNNRAVLASASTLEKEFKEKNKNTKNMESCKILGEMLAKRLKQKKINKIVFDRGVSPYHGRLQALAEAMRKGGIQF
ncbi:50S ribosomal protein L18 [Acidobacteriota bacterium]